MTTLVSFVLVMSTGPSSTMRVAIMQSAQTGPYAADVGSCVPSTVRNVLISIESDLLAQGVEGAILTSAPYGKVNIE